MVHGTSQIRPRTLGLLGADRSRRPDAPGASPGDSFVSAPSKDASQYDFFASKLKYGRDLTRWATIPIIPDRVVLGRARKIIQSVIGEQQENDLIFFAHTVRIGIDIHLLESAIARNDKAETDYFKKELGDSFHVLAERALSGKQKELAARLQYITADLYLNVYGYSEDALDLARGLTGGPLKETTSALNIVSDDKFSPYTTADRTRFLTRDEVLAQAKNGALARRIKIALQSARSNDLWEDVAWMGVGAVVGEVADVLVSGGTGVYGAWVGAAMGDTAYRFINGWRSKQAQQAANVETPVSDLRQIGADAARLAMDGLIGGAIYLIPAFIAAHAPEIVQLVETVGKNANSVYGTFGKPIEWLFQGASDWLSDPVQSIDLLKDALREWTPLPALASPGDVVTALWKIYEAFGAAALLAYVFSPDSRQSLNKVMPFSIPAAAGLSADLGQLIAGQNGTADYWSRILTANIAFFAQIVWSFVAGIIKTEKGTTPVGTKGAAHLLNRTIKLAWRLIKPDKQNSVPALGAASMVTGGILRPVAHYLQNGISFSKESTVQVLINGIPLNKDTIEGIVLACVVGALTSTALLPVAVGASGEIKGETNFLERLQETWEDYKNSPLEFPQRIFKLLEAVLEGLKGYVENRAWRGATIEAPVSGGRSLIGWDSPEGEAFMQAGNNLFVGPAATRIWNEKTGTRYGREAIQNMLAEGSAQEIIHSVRKMGLRVSALHWFRDWRFKKDAIQPIFSLFVPAQFPQKPNLAFWIDLHQMLRGRAKERLNGAQVNKLLETTIYLARDPNNNEVTRLLVKTLLMARDEDGGDVSEHGKAISAFFDRTPWMLDSVGVEEKDFPPVWELHLDAERKRIRKKLKMSGREYEALVKEYRRVEALGGKIIHDIDGLVLNGAPYFQRDRGSITGIEVGATTTRGPEKSSHAEKVKNHRRQRDAEQDRTRMETSPEVGRSGTLLAPMGPKVLK